MRAEQLRLALRPRPMVEAADLGALLAQDALPTLLRAWLPFALLLVVAAGATIEVAPWLPSWLLWWSKPWLDRMLLHVYARQVFGETTSFAQAWEARAAAPWGPLLRGLTLARLSPWRAYVMPVAQLEGQAGAVRRQRVAAILRGQHGSALGVQFVYSWIEVFLLMAQLSLIVWFTPGLRGFDTLRGLFEDIGLGTNLVLFGAYALSVLVVEPFYVAASFAMYLNRRVELEAWDVEQDLRHAFDQG